MQREVHTLGASSVREPTPSGEARLECHMALAAWIPGQTWDLSTLLWTEYLRPLKFTC